MQDNITIWVAVISGIIAVLGALGSQIVTAVFSFKEKRFGVYFEQKASAYKNLMDVIGIFALDPNNEEKYLMYLSALDTTTIFASDKVYNALVGHMGLNYQAQRLRQAPDVEDKETIRSVGWYECVKVLAQEMRTDLQK